MFLQKNIKWLMSALFAVTFFVTSFFFQQWIIKTDLQQRQGCDYWIQEAGYWAVRYTIMTNKDPSTLESEYLPGAKIIHKQPECFSQSMVEEVRKWAKLNQWDLDKK